MPSRIAYDVTISLKVFDPRALHNAAVAAYLDANPNAEPAEYEDFLGGRANPNISGCLRHLLDPGSLEGCEIEDSSAEVMMVFEDEDAPALAFKFGAGDLVLFSSTDADSATAPRTPVEIVRPLGEDEADAEVGPMYRVRAEDGEEYDAFEDELVARVLDADCQAGLHDWIGEPGRLHRDTTCGRCGERYGDPD